jgi:MFS family permease
LGQQAETTETETNEVRDYGLPERPGPYAIFQHRDYLLYTFARNIALIGLRMTGVAVGWQLYTLTHNAMTLAYVGLVQFIPVLLLAIPAGHAADRFGRKGIIQYAQVVMIAAALGLAAISHFHGSSLLVYACLFGASLASATSGPARSAMLPQLVPPRDYQPAIGWSTSLFQVASMVGPMLGGAVIAWAAGSPTPVYLVDAACGTTAFILTMFVVTRYGSQKPNSAPVTLESLTAGLRFVWEKRIILATITLDLFAVLLGGAVTLLPIYATDILHSGAGGLGILEAAPSIGAFLMALALAHLPPLKRPGSAMLWAVAGFGLATIGFGLSHNMWFSWAMLFLTGATDNISVVVRTTLVQVLTPDEMLGRVSAVNNVFISSSNQLGGFESGLVARLFGPIISVVAGGIGTILVVLGVGIAWPEVREFQPPA